MSLVDRVLRLKHFWSHLLVGVLSFCSRVVFLARSVKTHAYMVCMGRSFCVLSCDLLIEAERKISFSRGQWNKTKILRGLECLKSEEG